MAVFTAIAAAIGLGKIATAIFVAVGTFATSMTVSRLVAKRAMRKAQAGGDGGGRVQLPPATENKIPVVYGSAFLGGPVTDAYLSPDNKTMYYVITIAEHTDTTTGSGYTFDTGNVFYDGKLVTFGSDGLGGTTKVVSLTTNTTPAQVDTKVNGFLNIYLYKNGSTGATSGQNTTQNAYDVMPNWNSNFAMTNAAFAIVKVQYSTDAGTTGLGACTFKISNSINKPGTAIKDYMLNTRYGCAIPLARIDTDSLDDLDTYSDQLIDYEPVGGGTAQQARYRINGPLDTANNCLDNLQILVDSCDSWLQYSELTGKWKVVINKKYDEAPNSVTTNDLFLVDSSNLLGGIAINPIDLNDTYNELEVAYPNKNIKDQTDYQVVELKDYQVGVMSPNEAINRLNITLPLVNEAVQAKYLGVRRLLQSREDLVISFVLDFSGIQIEAGDVIRVTHETYGWTEKLFRVSSVAEEKMQDGSLQASVVAFEYNGTILEDQAITDYVPAYNTGLKDPKVISEPGTPVVSNVSASNALVTTFNVSSSVPDEGIVMFMDFNYGNSSNVQEHILYRTLEQANGTPFTNSDSGNTTYNNVSITLNDLPAGNYYFSTTARNDVTGKRSNASTVFNWSGPNINPYDPNTNTGGVIGNQIQSNTVTSNNLTTTGVIAGSYTNTNLTVDSAGRITAASNGTGGTGTGNAYYQLIGWAANQDAFRAGNITNAFSGFSGNQSLRIPGGIENIISGGSVTTGNYSLGANDYSPPFTNTSSTTNGFLANSTGRLEPALASYQYMSLDVGNNGVIETYIGGHGWFPVGSKQTGNFSSNNYTNEQFVYNGTFCIASDSNITIQVAGAAQYQYGNTYDLGYIVDYSTVQTIDLIEDKPITITCNFVAQGNLVNSSATANNPLQVVDMSCVMRNPEASSNLFVISGFWTVEKPVGNTANAPWGFTYNS